MQHGTSKNCLAFALVLLFYSVDWQSFWFLLSIFKRDRQKKTFDIQVLDQL